MVCSFDVFDTCLTRKTVVPSGVFYEAGIKTFARLGISANHSLLEDFVAARIDAERIARRQSDREEISLEEIWRILTRSMGWEYSDKMADCEIEAEDESLVPIASMFDAVKMARQQGNRIIFTSDMYLPADFIRRQLSKHSFSQTGDGIYVSSEVGKTKSSGNLFAHVLEREKIGAAELLHTGDNRHSDFEIPQKMGIQARLYESERLTTTELGLLQTEENPHKASRIAGAMRAYRLGIQPGENEAIYELVSQFAGPFVMGLACWVLQRAREDGVKRLYFASRDCQLLCKVANELSPMFGGIECRYLYISRQSLFLPSAGEITPEEMPWMKRDWEEPVLKKLLAKLNLKYEDVEPAFGNMAGSQRENYRLASAADWSRFWDALNTEPLKRKINDLIVQRRELTRSYFESAGLFDSVPWAVVDLGWTLSCQQALLKLLKKCVWNGNARGYYLGLVSKRVARAEAGPAEAMFYQPASDFPTGTRVSSIFARSTLLEHIVGCADHATVHHHDKLADGKMGAVYSGIVNESTLKFCREVHAGALDFVRKNHSLLADFSDVPACRNAIASLIGGFFASPTEKSARALSSLSATMDQNGFNTQSIVEPLNWGSTLGILLSNAGDSRKEADGCWFEGSMAITPHRVRKSFTMAQRAANRLTKLRGALLRR